jgi:MFS family permease
LSGFSDALIFTGLDSFPMVLAEWKFTVIQVGLAFIPLMLGYIAAYGIFLPVYKSDVKALKTPGKPFSPERRLRALTWLVWLEPVGLAIFGAASLGPPTFHWAVALLGTFLIGIANFAIYMATIDYMIAAYGPYAASATGGNGFCRDFLAGIAAMYTTPFYNHFKAEDTKSQKWSLAAPTLILCGVGLALCMPVIVFYVKGEWFRKRSPYAQELAQEREEKREERKDAITESKRTTPRTSRPASLYNETRHRSAADRLRDGRHEARVGAQSSRASIDEAPRLQLEF